MGTYRLTSTNGDEVSVFEARHSGEAIAVANAFARQRGSNDATLWVRKDDGDWLAFWPLDLGHGEP